MLSLVPKTHCRGNPKFNFHKYMIRALEDDFKTVVGIRQVTFIDISIRFMWHVSYF